MLLLTYNATEKITLDNTIYTYEKRWLSNGQYEYNTLRKRRAEIAIIVNYADKTITVNGRTFATRINYKFTYRKTKGNCIEVNCFDRFVDHLKKSATHKNVFHSMMVGFLLNLTKGEYSVIYP